MLLQILDNGRLTDAKGRVVNFKNTIIIMTSNIGGEYVQEFGGLGFVGFDEDTRERKEEGMKDKIRKSLERHFRPEFLNRLDEIIIFSSLSRPVVAHIVAMQFEDVRRRMERRDIAIAFTPALKEFIAERGYDEQYGARPLKRAIQSRILDPLAQELISGTITSGDVISADVSDGKVIFVKGIKKIAPKIRQRVSVKK